MSLACVLSLAIFWVLLQSWEQACANCACARRTNPNESWRIWAKTNESESGRIWAKPGRNRVKNGRIWANLGKKWATMGKKWANETESWQNRAKPKVSPKLYSDSGIPGFNPIPPASPLDLPALCSASSRCLSRENEVSF